ncbi:acyltransferase family protein [Aminobacter sp. J44]|uniref:acyltransferase family protein n=1 Tax=Aminobacter sp. J44 TaxID=935262 RepID=UPI0011A5ED40
MKQLSSIQAARGIAAWMVVAYHMLAIEKKYVSAALLPEIFAKGMLGVDVFFVISGFVMVHSTMGSPRGLPSAYHFLARRVIRVYPPYWFYSLLLVPVFLVAPQIINSAQGNDVSLLNSF